MTIMVSSWIYSIFYVVAILVILISFSLIGEMLIKKYNFDKNILYIFVVIASFITLIFIDSKLVIYYPMPNDIVINGKGEIIEMKNRNHQLITTDNNLFIFNNYPFKEVVLAQFQTKDLVSVNLEIEYTSNEVDLEVIRGLYNNWVQKVEERPKNIPLFISNVSYFFEVVKDDWEMSLKSKFAMILSSELTAIKIEEIISDIEASILNEYEQKAFTVTLLGMD